MKNMGKARCIHVTEDGSCQTDLDTDDWAKTSLQKLAFDAVQDCMNAGGVCDVDPANTTATSDHLANIPYYCHNDSTGFSFGSEEGESLL